MPPDPRKRRIIKIAERQGRTSITQCRKNRDSRARASKRQFTTKPSAVSTKENKQVKHDQLGCSHARSREYEVERRSHFYGRIKASDNARLHLGDSYVINNIFESMPTFRPWSYTMQELLPNIHTYFGRQCLGTERMRIVQYCMLVTINSNHRIRVLVTLLIPLGHELWYYASLDSPGRGSILAPPQSLLAEIYRALNDQGSLSNDYHAIFNVKHNKNDIEPQMNRQRCVDLSALSYPIQRLQGHLRNLSDQLQHFDCPWHFEDDLDYRSLRPRRPSPRLLARVEGQWTYMTRFAPDNWLFVNEYHTMQMFRHLDGTPGFARFRGVVRDSAGRISAFLNDLPARGRLTYVFSGATKLGTCIPLTQRLMWCKQLVKCVAEAHARNLVLGLLTYEKDPRLGVDHAGNIMLYSQFEKLIKPRIFTPPEMAHIVGDFWATFQTDIYQLGLILWGIAGHRIGSSKAEICREAKCMAVETSSCLIHDDNTVSLPMNSDNYPAYLRTVISSCREPNHLERAHAETLLGMFPADATPAFIDTHISGPSIDLEEYRRMYAGSFCCNHCDQPCDSHHFHCGICNSSNFDICARCFFEKGSHCYDDQHFMREYYVDAIIDRCYSSVVPDGKRQEWSLTEVVLQRGT